MDTSRYGLATALPSAIAAALDAPVEPPVPRRRQQRRQQARQQWRAAVADAAVGAPTPIVVRAPARALDVPWRPAMTHSTGYSIVCGSERTGPVNSWC